MGQQAELSTLPLRASSTQVSMGGDLPACVQVRHAGRARLEQQQHGTPGRRTTSAPLSHASSQCMASALKQACNPAMRQLKRHLTAQRAQTALTRVGSGVGHSHERISDHGVGTDALCHHLQEGPGAGHGIDTKLQLEAQKAAAERGRLGRLGSKLARGTPHTASLPTFCLPSCSSS